MFIDRGALTKAVAVRADAGWLPQSALVIAGLDLAIHLFRKMRFAERWTRGSSLRVKR
jgi:hypothetical protein